MSISACVAPRDIANSRNLNCQADDPKAHTHDLVIHLDGTGAPVAVKRDKMVADTYCVWSGDILRWKLDPSGVGKKFFIFFDSEHKRPFSKELLRPSGDVISSKVTRGPRREDLKYWVVVEGPVAPLDPIIIIR